MRFKIKGEAGEKEKIVELYLEEGEGEEGEGVVTLRAREDNNNGKGYYVMSFFGGKFKRIENVAFDIGIEVDEDGKIKEI